MSATTSRGRTARSISSTTCVVRAPRNVSETPVTLMPAGSTGGWGRADGGAGRGVPVAGPSCVAIDHLRASGEQHGAGGARARTRVGRDGPGLLSSGLYRRLRRTRRTSSSDLLHAADPVAAAPLVGSSRVSGPYHRSGIAPCPEGSGAILPPGRRGVAGWRGARMAEAAPGFPARTVSRRSKATSGASRACAARIVPARVSRTRARRPRLPHSRPGDRLGPWASEPPGLNHAVSARLRGLAGEGGPGPACNEVSHRAPLDGFREQVALAEPATQLPQPLELHRRLDPFGNGRQPERPPDLDDRTDDPGHGAGVVRAIVE